MLEEPPACMLFDVYGTLLISGSGDTGITPKNTRHRNHLQPLLDKYRISGSSQDLLNRFHAAVDRDHDRKKDAGCEYPEIVVERIWQQILPFADPDDVRSFALEFEMISNPTYPMPGLKQLLAACRRSRMRMGIISNAQFYTPLLFEYFLGADLGQLGFDPDLTLFSYQHQVAKPSPILFNIAADRLQRRNCRIDRTLYIGNDMLKDVFPAKIKGFCTALFAGDRRSLRLRPDDARCRQLEPDLVVTDLKQLAELPGGQLPGKTPKGQR